jgi:hypothetical protein
MVVEGEESCGEADGWGTTGGGVRRAPFIVKEKKTTEVVSFVDLACHSL